MKACHFEASNVRRAMRIFCAWLAVAAAVMGGLTALKQESPEEYWRLIQDQAGLPRMLCRIVTWLPWMELLACLRSSSGLVPRLPTSNPASQPTTRRADRVPGGHRPGVSGPLLRRG